MMNELVAFYAARLDEDEQIAKAAIQGPWHTCDHDDDCDAYGVIFGTSPIRSDRWVQVANLEIAWQKTENTAHITRHDPARVLRDIAADRKLIARYKAAVESHEEALQTLAAARKQWGGMSQETDDAYGDTITTSARAGAFLTALEDRAARFFDHEDYQPHWRQP